MARNLKIIMNDYNYVSGRNNVNFNASIPIPKGSSLALTSFNATLDIAKTEHELPSEEIGFYYTQVKGFKNVAEIPAKTYNSGEQMIREVSNALNGLLRPLNANRDIVDGKKLSIIPASASNEKTVFKLDTYPFTKVNLISSIGENENEFYEDELVEIEDLETPQTQYLLKGGGVTVRVPMTLSFDEEDTDASYIELIEKNGIFKSNNYYVRLNWNIDDLDEPHLYFTYKRPEDETEVRTADIPSEEFFDYKDSPAPTTGPFAAYNANRYFVIQQQKGKIQFLYNNDGVYTTIKTNDFAGFPWSSEKHYLIRCNVVNGSKINKNAFQATIESSEPKTGSDLAITPYINWQNAPEFSAIFGAKEISDFLPPSNYSSSFSCNFDFLHSPLTNFELALEIDNIQVENYVGYKNNDADRNPGRKNVVAYFTPTPLFTNGSYSYSFTPNEAIYLKVANLNDITINNISTRLYNTFTGKNFECSSVTFVLTLRL